MKKITIILLLLVGFLGFAQSKSTGVVTIVGNVSVELVLNNTTQIATITMTGPSDRWFAVKLGNFSSGMSIAPDVYYYNGSTLIDASQGGGGPINDATQNITVTSNTVVGSVRTIVATRPFITGDATDFTYVYTSTFIDIAGAHGDQAGYNLAYHGPNNRATAFDTTFTTLGVDDFTLNATKIYPNPSKGIFNVESKSTLEKINVYSQTGVLVKTIEVDSASVGNFEVNMQGLQTGVYLLELQNSTEKTWKKIVID
jgi:hypothetical protein